MKSLSYLELIASQVASGRVQVVSNLRTDAASEETQVGILRGLLKPRVLLVHHEKSLLVDVPLTNLAIKYNMLYVSTF